MLALLAAYGLAVVVALIFVLRWERREFARTGKARAWRTVRLATVPIALVTAAAVIVPTRRISGMEALGVFYLLLFTAAPLLWVGLHALAGRLARPRLGTWDVLQLALLPPAFAIAAAIVAHQLQPVAWAFLR